MTGHAEPEEDDEPMSSEIDGRARNYINSHRAHTIITRLGDLTDTDMTIGRRLEEASAIAAHAHDVERRLLLQIGVDLAKHLAASGIEPTGRPISEIKP